MNVRNESILHPVQEPSAVKYLKNLLLVWFGLWIFLLFLSTSGQKDKPKYLFSHLENENNLKKISFGKWAFMLLFSFFYIQLWWQISN